MVVDAALAVRFANPCATMLLESAWPGAIRNGRLFESHGEFRGALQPLVERGEGALVLHRDIGQAPLELMVSSFADRPAGADPAEDRLALVWIVDPDYVPTSYHESLRDLYGVTPAESRVAAALRRGMRLEESAQQLGISHATIRTHVRKLCEKLTAERKAELLWRLNGCAAALLVATDWVSPFKDLF